MRVVIASDGRGDRLRAGLLEAGDLALVDGGTHTDYPDAALAVADALIDGRADRGVAICGSGVGVAIVLCKIPGLRAAPVASAAAAVASVEHGDCAAIALGADSLDLDGAVEILRAFADARFSEAPRHRRRLEAIAAVEAGDRRLPDRRSLDDEGRSELTPS